MWTLFETVFLVLWVSVILAFAAILAIGLFGGLFALAFEWFSDIWWNIKETWKEYWK